MVGGFNAELFPRGYGEENDFCIRAADAGLQNLLAPHVLVRHARSQSFGDARQALAAKGRAIIDAVHPTYKTRVSTWLHSNETKAIRSRARGIQQQLTRSEEVLPRRLYVLHRGGGGTPATNLDLMRELASFQESYLLESIGGRSLVLSVLRNGSLFPIETWSPNEPFNITDTWREDYASFITKILISYGIELVHTRHLINYPLTTLSEVCRRLGIRSILSTHDFYMLCPTVHLLDEHLNHCGGVCTPGGGLCNLPVKFVRSAPLPLKHGWVHEWRRRSKAVLDQAETVIATTESASEVLGRVYPEIRDKITIVEHGRSIGDVGLARGAAARRPGPLRVLAPANWAEQKGPGYLRKVAKLTGDYVEWHILGKRSDTLEDVGVSHGSYERENLPTLVREIDPDLIAIFSIWPETYSHTLTEAWAMGVPVVATDIGAVADRIRAHGGGLTVPVDDPAQAAEVLVHLAHAPERVHEVTGRAPRARIRSARTMAEDYRYLYDYPKKVSGWHGKPVGLILGEGDLGARNIGISLRQLASWVHDMIQVQHARWRITSPQDVIAGTDRASYDALVVVGDVLTNDEAVGLASLANSRGIRLVLILDTDGFSDKKISTLINQGYPISRLEGLRYLIGCANEIVTSTQELVDELHSFGRTAVVRPPTATGVAS